MNTPKKVCKDSHSYGEVIDSGLYHIVFLSGDGSLTGLYSVKVETNNGMVLSSDLTLEIKKDGASYIQLPMNIALLLNGPSEVSLVIYKKDSPEVVAEVGKFSVLNAE